MNIKIIHNDTELSINPEQHITYARQVIWVGVRSTEVYNTISIEGLDTFQCTIAYNKSDNTWRLTRGQVRTHCARGLKSDRSRACSLCRGCCGYIHTANPDYSLRVPAMSTLLNGTPVPEEGMTLKDGDTIHFQ